MLRSGQGGLTPPPPPYGQPDRKISGFFLTTSLSSFVDSAGFPAYRYLVPIEHWTFGALDSLLRQNAVLFDFLSHTLYIIRMSLDMGVLQSVKIAFICIDAIVT